MNVSFSYLYIRIAIKKPQLSDINFLVCIVENVVDIVSMFTTQVHLFTREEEEKRSKKNFSSKINLAAVFKIGASLSSKPRTVHYRLSSAS